MTAEYVPVITVFIGLITALIQLYVARLQSSINRPTQSTMKNKSNKIRSSLRLLGWVLIFFSLSHLGFIQFAPGGADPATVADVAGAGSCVVGCLLGIWAVKS